MATAVTIASPSGAEQRIEVAHKEAVFALVDLVERLGLIGFDGRDRLFKHDLSVRRSTLHAVLPFVDMSSNRRQGARPCRERCEVDMGYQCLQSVHAFAASLGFLARERRRVVKSRICFLYGGHGVGFAPP